MTEQTLTRIGRFVWHDMMTTDLERSREFHSALLGWTTEELPLAEGETYPMIKAGAAGIGGYEPLDPKQGIPSHWIGYVTVEDLEAAVSRAKSAGGQVAVPPTDIPGTGRFAVLVHPGGSIIAAFLPRRLEDCVPEGDPVPGRFCWNQIMTRDPAAAGAFYRKVFGWEVEEQDVGGNRYWLFRRDGTPAAGMMATPGPEKHPDFWLPYVEVDDVDACAARAKELGGQVMVPPSDIPGLARFAVTADPTGAILAVSRHFER